MILVSRIFVGMGESFGATGSTIWGIGRVGTAHTARVISWNGVATFSALAFGAPLGIFLEKRFGLFSVGLGIATISGLSIALARMVAPVTPKPGETLPTKHVFQKVLPCGVGLALGTVGFASIATFITLFYESQSWANGAWSLTAYGIVFVFSRLFLANSIYRFGGYRVAAVSFVVECVGLAWLGLAGSGVQALLACAVVGLGFALIFPALGVEAVMRVSESNRGSALGPYSLFTDCALAVTGPIGGILAKEWGFRSVFLFAAFSAASAVALMLVILQSRRERAAASPEAAL
jgi:predicted MFS family arabinose efflux permease